MKTDAGRAEQDAEIFRLRCRGHSLRTIAAAVGLSHQTVANRIEDAIRELLVPAAEQWRAEETARLHDLARAAYEVLDNAETDDLKLKAIDRLTKLSESRRKLWALDAPQPIDIALSQRADAEGETVAAALGAALEALTVSGLDPVRQEQLRVHALELAQWKLLQMGKQDAGPRPTPPVSAMADMPVATAEEPESDVMRQYREWCEAEGIDPDEDQDGDEDGDDE